MDGEEHQINDEINNHDHEQKLKEKKVLFHLAYNIRSSLFFLWFYITTST